MSINSTRVVTTASDIIDRSIVENPHSISQRFRNRVFEHVRRHREIFGFPPGCGKVPYMFVSNDLAGTFFDFVKMVLEHKDHEEMNEVTMDMINIVEMLVMTYDDQTSCSAGCCHFWHSDPKDIFVALHQTMTDVMNADE